MLACLSVYLSPFLLFQSLCLSFHLPLFSSLLVDLSVYLSRTSLSLSLFFFLNKDIHHTESFWSSFSQSICLSLFLMSPSLCLSFSPSSSISVLCLSVYLSVCLSLCQFFLIYHTKSFRSFLCLPDSCLSVLLSVCLCFSHLCLSIFFSLFCSISVFCLFVSLCLSFSLSISDLWSLSVSIFVSLSLYLSH